jgi:hypothetical protein
MITTQTIRLMSKILGIVLVVLLLGKSTVYGANGINEVITLQGKVTNANNTNVTDGVYDFVVKLYDGAASAAANTYTESWTAATLLSSLLTTAPAAAGESLVYTSNVNEATLKVGQILWNVTKEEAVTITTVNTATNTLGISPTRVAWATSDTITNGVYVKDGVFVVNVNSLNTNFTGVNFGTDNIFIGVNFNADGEMKPRTQFKAVPYAFSAKSVNGLQVTATNGVLTIPSGKTVQFADNFTTAGANALTLTTTAATNVTLPTTGTLATLQGVETFSGAKTFSTAPTLSTITSGSTLFAGAGGLVSQDNANFFYDDTNNRLGVGTATPSTTLSVNSNAINTTAIQTIANSVGDYQSFITAANPESAIIGNIGDIANDITGGNLYYKQTGTTTNTGWKKFLTSTGLGTFTTGSILFAGSAGDIVQDNTVMFYDQVSNKIGFGTNTPGTSGGITTLRLEFADDTGANSDVLQRVAGGGWGAYYHAASRGTKTAPTISLANDNLGEDTYVGYDGVAYREAGKLLVAIDGAPAANSMPGRLSLYTTPTGSITPLERLRIDNAGNILLGTTTSSAGLTINKSTLFTTQAIANLVAGGAIGTAAATVDIATSFTINQTTAGQTITLPNPTNATAGRVAYITNIGTASFTLLGSAVAAGSSRQAVFNGTVWVLTGDGTGAATSLSALAAAAGANTIDNTLFSQSWNWSTLTTQNALSLSANTLTTGSLLNASSSTTAVGASGDLAKLELTGNSANVTGNALKVGITGAGAAGTSLNVTNAGTGLSLRINDDGTYTDASAFIVDNIGNVGIGTSTAANTLTFGNAANTIGVNSVNGTLAITSNGTGLISIDSGTTGAVNIGTNANAKTISIGNNTATTALNFVSGTGLQTFTSSANTTNAFNFVADGVTTADAFTLSTSALSTGNAFKITGPSGLSMVRVSNVSADPLDDVRFTIGAGGISASKPDSLARDQLYVFGRINSSWNMFSQDFLTRTNNAIAVDGTLSGAYFDEATGGSGSMDQIDIAGTSGVAFLNNPTSPAANENEWWGTGGIAITQRSLNPVLETRLAATASNDHRVVVGLLDIALNAAYGADTNQANNEIMFRKSAAGTTWDTVTRNAGGAENVITTTVTTTAFHTLRIEVENIGANGTVRFYADGTLVATHTTAAVPAATARLGWYIGNAITNITNRGTSIDYMRIWSDDPPSVNGLIQDTVQNNINSPEEATSSSSSEETAQEAILDPTNPSTLTTWFSDMLQSVRDAIFNSIRVTSLAEFFGKAIFNSDTEIKGSLTVNNNTAGRATIKKGASEVVVTFDKAYISEPIINATLTLPSAITDEMLGASVEALFTKNPLFIITKQSVNSFTITLSKPAATDIMFNWQATQVENAKEWVSTAESSLSVVTISASSSAASSQAVASSSSSFSSAQSSLISSQAVATSSANLSSSSVASSSLQ